MKQEKKKKRGKLGKFIYLLLVLVSLIFMGILYYLNMLPSKYFVLLICGVVVVLGIFGLVLLNTKVKKVIRFFFSLLSVVLIIAMGIGSNYMFNAKDIINKITEKINYKTENYSVVVLDDSEYEELDDLKDETLGYLDNNTEGTKKALFKLKEKVSTKNETYDDISSLAEDLLDEEITAILIEDSYKAILDETTDDFIDSTRILYSFSVKVPEKKTSKKVDVTKESFNIYISGIDTYGKITSVSRSDVNIIATVNPKTGKVILTDIPRDYYVTLPSKGKKDKLTHAGIYGVDESIQTIEDLLDININYYVKVNFTSVVTLIDALDGVTVHSDYNFVSEDNYRYYQGDNNVDGKRALSFVRERHAFNEGDVQRGKNQMYMIQAIADELMSFKSITKFNSLLDTMDGAFETNISSDEISDLVKMQIDRNIKWKIETYSLEGTGSSEYTYSYPSSPLYVTLPDEVSIATAQTKISKVFNGEN